MAYKEFGLKMIAKYDRETCASEELCSFLATLMNSEITTLTIPPLSNTMLLMDHPFKGVTEFCYYQVLTAAGKATKSLEELNKAARGVTMLMDTIGTKCPKLKSLHIQTLSTGRPFIPLKKGCSLGDTFFKVVLPRLTILNMDSYEFDDWALIQIGSHGSSLE
jgi:hypothetical protein